MNQARSLASIGIAALAISFVVLLVGCGTPGPVATPSDLASVEYVVEIPGKTSEEIYDGVKLWIAENFNSAKSVIDLEDRKNGLIVGNGVVPNVVLRSGLAELSQNGSFKMKVEVKEAKMRLTFSHFSIVGRSWGLYKSEADQIRDRVKGFGTEISAFFASPKAQPF